MPSAARPHPHFVVWFLSNPRKEGPHASHYRTAGIDSCVRRYGCRVAARRARAAAEENLSRGAARHRRPDGCGRQASADPSLRSGRGRLRRRPEPRFRAAIGRRAPRATRRPRSRAQGRPCGCHHHIRLSRGAGRQKVDQRHTNRHKRRGRSGRDRPGRWGGAARRQHHRRDGTVDRAQRQAPRNLKGRCARRWRAWPCCGTPPISA